MTQRFVEIHTEEGTCPAALSVPDGEGPWPAVIMYPDAGGMRQTLRQMGERLSRLGYLVLMPDCYYRFGDFGPIDAHAAFQSKEAMEEIIARARSYTVDMAVRDARAFLEYLSSRPEKAPGGIGTTGYCMGGRLSLIAAWSLGPAVAAAASFHGGNLAKDDDPGSPHHHAGAIAATVYVAGAVDDPSFPLEQKDRLETALSDAGVAHTIEMYPARHGFAVPDNPTYDEAADSRHWRAMEALFAAIGTRS